VKEGTTPGLEFVFLVWSWEDFSGKFQTSHSFNYLMMAPLTSPFPISPNLRTKNSQNPSEEYGLSGLEEETVVWVRSEQESRSFRERAEVAEKTVFQQQQQKNEKVIKIPRILLILLANQ